MPPRHVSSRSHRLWTLVLLLAISTAVVPAAYPAPQHTAETVLRTVHGVALDSQRNPVRAAVVYIRNLRTERVRTYITGKRGRYHFTGLGAYDDFEVYAEYGDFVSARHTVLRSESKLDTTVELIVDRAKTR